MWKTTWKNLVAHKLRLSLTALSVVLGVAFMAGTFVLTDTLKHTFDSLFAQTSVGKLGLTLQSGHDGVTITDVDPSSVAADKGLQQGDVILEAGGKTVERPTEVAQAFDAAHSDGRKSVLLRIKSGDNIRFVALPAQAAS